LCSGRRTEPDAVIGRAGIATLPGHPESGEEAFIVEIDEAGEAWFTVRALLARISGPFGRGAQHLMARRCTRAMQTSQPG
jgi:uncharacterized protein (UPF0548 family)